MSSTPPSRSPGQTSPGSTRQLLDELDTLMQRMLALPVNQLEDDTTLPQAPAILPAPPPEERTSNAEGGTAGTTLTGQAGISALDAGSAGDAGPARKVVAHPPAAIFPQLPHRSEATIPHRPEPERFTPPDEPAVIIPPAPATAAAPVTPTLPGLLPRPSLRPASAPGMSPVGPRLMPPATVTPSQAARRLPAWLLRSLLWSNRTFDRWTGWLGRPGRWLRGPLGRTVLGWVGLGLWAVALTALLWHILR